MARKKPDIPQIRDLAEVDAVLGEIAEAQRELMLIETAMNEAIDAAKRTAAEQAAPLQARIRTLGESLGAYSTYHKSELFRRGKTLRFNHGEIGFRKTTALKPQTRLRWADVLERLRETGRREGIRVREDVNKEVLREWSDSELEAVGARLVSKDEFWYEVKQESVEDAA